jgi:hypothetical protein
MVLIFVDRFTATGAPAAARRIRIYQYINVLSLLQCVLNHEKPIENFPLVSFSGAQDNRKWPYVL